MPLANCANCDKLFSKITSNICPECLEEEEKTLRLIHEYLRKNPKATKATLLQDFLEHYDITLEESQLEKWVKDKRINLVLHSEELKKARCRLCGREIQAGESICRTCKISKLGQQNHKTPKTERDEKSQSSKTQGMHFKRWGNR